MKPGLEQFVSVEDHEQMHEMVSFLDLVLQQPELGIGATYTIQDYIRMLERLIEQWHALADAHNTLYLGTLDH